MRVEAVLPCTLEIKVAHDRHHIAWMDKKTFHVLTLITVGTVLCGMKEHTVAASTTRKVSATTLAGRLESINVARVPIGDRHR